MTSYEKYSLIIQSAAAIATSIFAIWQIFINLRLKKLNDFVAVAILPNSEGNNIKLLNTGKINLYIHGFDINGSAKIFDKGRLISSATLDSAYYWIPLHNIPESGVFPIKIWLTDEFGTKYITQGQGESSQHGEKDKNLISVSVWALKTYKEKWEF